MAGFPLEGVRVLDICPMHSGNFGTGILADLGAEVIKVESIQHWQYGARGTTARPTREQLRQGGEVFSYPDSDPGPRPWNVFVRFLLFGRSKLSFTVDLRKPEGVEVFKRLIAVSDVLIESNSPPLMPRLGLDYPQLKVVNPALIMLRVPGYGLSGPYRDRLAMAPTLEAFTGHVLLKGYAGTDPSTTPTAGITCDGAAGAALAVAALAALYFRKRTGKGQLVEVAQVENFMPMLGEFYMDYAFNKRLPKAIGNRHPTAAPCGCYPCAGQDQWVDITVHDDEEWQGFCRALGDPAWTRDPELATVVGRYGKQDEMDRELSEWTRARDRYDIMHLLQRQGVPCGPVLSCKDVYSDPHLLARGHFQAVAHPEAGTHLHPVPPWKMSRTPVPIRSASPLLGQHNEYVYKEVLGYSDDAYARLEADGHIGDEPAAHLP